MPARIFGGGQPVLRNRLERFDRHSGLGGDEDGYQVGICELCHRSPVARNNGLEGLGGFPLGMLRRQSHQALEGKDHLGIHGMLNPGRAILIEGGEAVLGRHIIRIRLIGGHTHKVEDGLLGRAVIP